MDTITTHIITSKALNYCVLHMQKIYSHTRHFCSSVAAQVIICPKNGNINNFMKQKLHHIVNIQNCLR